MLKRSFYFLIFILLLGCKKDDENLFSISIESTSPTSLVEFSENIMVRINYEHPDGYVGFYNPDYLSLEVKDSRLENADYYHLIPINPPNQNLSTSGNILIEIDAPFVLGNGLTETLTYSIRIQDREMKWSNAISTPSIVVTKQ